MPDATFLLYFEKIYFKTEINHDSSAQLSHIVTKKTCAKHKITAYGSENKLREDIKRLFGSKTSGKTTIYQKKCFNKARLFIKQCARLGILKSDRQNTSKDQQSAINRLNRIEATRQKIKNTPSDSSNNRRCDAK